MAFSAVVDLSALNGTNGTVFQGIDALDYSGNSVSNAGDINGDGFDDLIIGAYGGDPNSDAEAGETYVVFGLATGFGATFDLSTLDGTNGFILEGQYPGDWSGYSVSNAGDVNGDGFDDILVGAYRWPVGQFKGQTYLVYGQETGFSATLDLSALDGSNGVIFDAVSNGSQLGYSVSSAGDVNGDGIDDILIGAPEAWGNGQWDNGVSYVVFGQTTGLSSSFDLSSLDGTNGFSVIGVTSQDHSGYSVSNAGDVNGDGFDDLLIGAHQADPNGNSGAGASYVVFGQASGFSASFDLSTLDGTNGFALLGIDPGDFSGRSVSNVGDINGDGYDDFIIGAHEAEPGGNNQAGETYVVFGQASGFSASLDLSTLNGVNGFLIEGLGQYNRNGFSVSSAGDVNGDGFDDILIGANGSDNNSGESYVIFGQATGFSANFDLTSLDGTNGFLLSSSGSLSGYSVSTAGDINGDGFADVLIGAPYTYVNGNQSTGETYLYYGQAPTVAVTRTGSDADQMISGGALADTLYGMAGDDILSGGYGDDMLDGGTGFDVASFNGFGGTVTVSLLVQGVSQNTGPAGSDTLISIEGLSGGQFNDNLTGSTGGNTLHGLSGSDFLFGLGGADTLVGGNGNDNMQGGNGDDDLSGGGGIDTMLGGAGTDTLSGNAGNDQLRGGDGSDTLIGGAGRDVLIGGSVISGDIPFGSPFSYRFPGDGTADTFVFLAVSDSAAGGATRDIIRDFEVGLDMIDLSAIDAAPGGGDDAFAFIGATSFTHTAGELQSFIIGANTVVRADVDGDGSADFEVFLNGMLALTGADFIL